MFNYTRALLLITILIGVGVITSYVHADVSHLAVDGEFICLFIDSLTLSAAIFNYSR